MWGVTTAANAPLAKARAMYGRALKPDDYEELLRQRTVGEIAAYLKQHTAYAGVLADVQAATIHRGHLESLLRRKLAQEYASLGRYDLADNAHMAAYLVRRSETDQLVACLRLISAGRADEFFFTLPPFLASRTRIDPVKLSQCTTYDGLLDAVRASEYYDILRPFAPPEGQLAPLTAIETALYAHLISWVFDTIRHLPRQPRAELEQLYGAMVDAENVARLLRLKRYFGADPEDIRRQLLPHGCLLTPREWERLIAAPTAEEALHTFAATRWARRLPGKAPPNAFDWPQRVYFHYARKQIHFSTHPLTVLFAYIVLSTIEVDNIVKIIEGARYGLDPAAVRPLLVLAA